MLKSLAELTTDFKDLCDDCLEELHMFLSGAKLILEDCKND